jgi:ACS family hexuronate transporter-like MFS transporter
LAGRLTTEIARTEISGVTAPKLSPIPALRWWIGGLLFASTVINYVDRQTLSLLAPYLKLQYHWTNSDYADIVIGFRVAYSIGQMICGRLMDRIGARRGLTLTVVWYSIASMLTALASGFYSFLGFRFWERGNPGTGQLRLRL